VTLRVLRPYGRLLGDVASACALLAARKLANIERVSCDSQELLPQWKLHNNAEGQSVQRTRPGRIRERKGAPLGTGDFSAAPGAAHSDQSQVGGILTCDGSIPWHE
jgi:hypothetical protein